MNLATCEPRAVCKPPVVREPRATNLAMCEPQAACEPRAGCEPPAAREPRAVNRGQSVSLAVCEGASLCGGVLLKGPGRSRPGAEGAGSSRLGFAGAEMKARGPFSGWRFLCPLQAASAIL